MSIVELIEAGAHRLAEAGVAFGQGTDNAFDEAAWLVLWQLGLPLDTPLDDPASAAHAAVTPQQQAAAVALLTERIESRKPAAYLTHEAWLMGVPFYVDERSIVPRSLIAELLVSGAIDPWLGEQTARVLDLCTGNGSLAVLAAMSYPDVSVDACDISEEALAVARINVAKHGLESRIHLLCLDGLSQVDKGYDLILCNPPYVNADSMARLPPEFRAEPALALDGNRGGASNSQGDGMDFIRQLLSDVRGHLSAHGVLVLEVGNERAHFEAAFPQLEAVWLETSAGADQVLLLTQEALLTCHEHP